MYLVGADHPLKVDTQLTLERVIASREKLVTDAEVIQEILHRYISINRREAIEPALNLLLQIADDVFPIDKIDVLRASEIIHHPAQLSARDALHVAVMERYGVGSIFSFDGDFDRWRGIHRIPSR